jgi:hypothetical protein
LCRCLKLQAAAGKDGRTIALFADFDFTNAATCWIKMKLYIIGARTNDGLEIMLLVKIAHELRRRNYSWFLAPSGFL